MREFDFIADTTIPGLSKSEMVQISANDQQPRRVSLRGLTTRQLRDLGLDRSAS